MKIDEPISTIMTKNLVTIDKETPLRDAEGVFVRHHIRHLPVTSGKKMVGLLSLTDLRRLSFVDYYGEEESEVDTAVYNMLGVPQLMIANPVSVQASETIREVATLLSEQEFHAVPVLDGEDLVGIVSTTDLIKFLLNQNDSIQIE